MELGPRAIVLASTSPFRRELLLEAGIAHTAYAPAFEETHGEALPPLEIAVAYARAKAESLAERHPDALIIGADQVPEIDGEVLVKPGSVEKAIAQLERLQGRTHRTR
jgi:septum formation protein